MAKIDIQPELEAMKMAISNKNLYYGNRIPESIMKMIEIEIREDGAGILAPSWLGVLQHGRGKRKSSTSSHLAEKIYAWMAKHNMFRSKTAEGKLSEAKSLTWYINKYGNKQFRSKAFIDVYESARQTCIQSVENKYVLTIGQITKGII